MSNPFTVSKHLDQLKTTRLVDESHQYDDPLPAKDLVFLQSVNKKECVIKSAQVNSRLSHSLPMFVVLLIMMFYTLLLFIDNHYSSYFTFQDTANYFSGKYGAHNLPAALNHYLPYMQEEKVGFIRYLMDYYSDKIYRNDEFKIIKIIGWLIFFPGALYISGLLSFFAPMTQLVADRKRGILYSYTEGIVTATRYEDAQFGYAGKMLAFKLFYIHPETGELGTHIYRPNISHYTGFLMSSDTENHRFITFLNAFMQQGRDAVSPVDYQARKPFLSFGKNPLPADFEQQVDQILAKLDWEKKRNA